MSKRFLWGIFALLVISATGINICYAKVSVNDSTNTKQRNSAVRLLFFHYVDDIYKTAALSQSGLDSAVFQDAVTGYYNLKISNKLPANSSILTIVDYNKSATAKRMWIVDLQNKKLLLNTSIASNKPTKVESSLDNIGFYITAEVYTGKYGQALKLDGMDTDFNGNARTNEVVLIGADNVSQQASNTNCPAIHTEVLNQVMGLIKNKNVLFINRKSNNYSSNYLDEDRAAKFAFADSSFNLVKDVMGN